MAKKMLTRSRLALLLTGALVVVGGAVYLWLLRDLPDPRQVSSAGIAPSTIIYDRRGRVLYEILDPNLGQHQPVSLESIPLWLREATVATEDASFYTNPGVDARAILRALWINLRGGEVLSGGSTITQQLARYLLLSPEERTPRTLRRKLRESILAFRLARTLSKERILELYLNQIYYGNLAYGVEAASRTYFGKPVQDLDLAECALIAGLPQAPALYDPLSDPAAAEARQAVVLGLLVKQGVLAPQEAEQAANEQLHYAATPFPIRAPHFIMYVWGLLRQEFGDEQIYRLGLRVHTTLDVDLQARVESLARYHLSQLSVAQVNEPAHNVTDAAVVAIDPRNGQILAMLGSPDYFDLRISGAVNVALMPRQPGSAIKPVTYAAAFSNDPAWTPATMVLDIESAFTTREGATYVPVNYDRIYHGPVLLREALGSSLNVVAVKTLDHVGVPQVVNLAQRMGLSTLTDPQRYGLSLTLGGGEVRLLDLTAAYAAFASGGLRVDPVAITRVEAASGALLRQAATPARARVLDEKVAFWITDILADDEARIPAFGEDSALVLDRPAAAKTGTTTDWRDNWTVGYTPQLVVGVWTGNADNSPMVDVSGISGAAPLWHDVMLEALKGQAVLPFDVPQGMVRETVCAESGALPGPWCPVRQEWFIEGHGPTATCTMHRRVEVDSRTGELASPDTRPEYLRRQVGVFLPAEAADWVAEQQYRVGVHYFIDRTSPAGGSAKPAPAVVLVSPRAGTTYRMVSSVPEDSQRIEVRAQASVEVASLRLYADDQLLNELTSPPYATLWQLTPGEHTFVAELTDPVGRSFCSEAVQITVLR